MQRRETIGESREEEREKRQVREKPGTNTRNTLKRTAARDKEDDSIVHVDRAVPEERREEIRRRDGNREEKQAQNKDLRHTHGHYTYTVRIRFGFDKRPGD